MNAKWIPLVAAIGVVSATPAFAAVSYEGLTRTLAGDADSSSLKPFVFGDGSIGGSAGPRLLTSWAQTTLDTGYIGATVGSTAVLMSNIDLTSLAPFADRVIFRFNFQLGGVDSLSGNGDVATSFGIGYNNNVGEFVGITGSRVLSRVSGGSLKITQSVDNSLGPVPDPISPSRYRGSYRFDLTLDPNVTPNFLLLAYTTCDITQSSVGTSYCNASLGFSSTTALLGLPRGSALSRPLASIAAVPEPASWTFAIAGFGAVGVTMRRRRTAMFRTAG